jgi:hypothetical protein
LAAREKRGEKRQREQEQEQERQELMVEEAGKKEENASGPR